MPTRVLSPSSGEELQACPCRTGLLHHYFTSLIFFKPLEQEKHRTKPNTKTAKFFTAVPSQIRIQKLLLRFCQQSSADGETEKSPNLTIPKNRGATISTPPPTKRLHGSPPHLISHEDNPVGVAHTHRMLPAATHPYLAPTRQHQPVTFYFHSSENEKSDPYSPTCAHYTGSPVAVPSPFSRLAPHRFRLRGPFSFPSFVLQSFPAKNNANSQTSTYLPPAGNQTRGFSVKSITYYACMHATSARPLHLFSSNPLSLCQDTLHYLLCFTTQQHDAFLPSGFHATIRLA
ncbi:UNVERIFIED_CONTAM: hypothetical protein Sangu_0032300 [Sesamum angustifolium]|uniref:Uncharacterized protein n=1 Tax=Sesamum angustifolium TaxID=2727405 RepID=A0AAW2RH36_9LAMI